MRAARHAQAPDRVLHSVMAAMVFLILGLLWWGREWFVIVVWSVLSAMGWF